ncbi:MAG: ATP-binding protein [Cobetia sp.]|uniref:ATP-binding protein n=1 Tax=Cobetia sp. TaxID=1873876 RepID=UPI003242B641
MEIKLPAQFIPSSLSKLKADLTASQYLDNVNVDFSPLSYSKPMSMLVAGSYFRRWISCRRNLGLHTTKSGISKKINAHSYLMHLGFFDYAGMTATGNKLGVAKGNTKYLPIREISRSELDEYMASTGESLINAIIFISDGLATILAGEDNRDVMRCFSYAIREVIRNALEHSTSNSCYICGQRWVDGQSEIAIIDEGCGIYESLSTAYELQEEDALDNAIKPGVTRTHSMSETENIYQNSGFGLYVLSELGNSFGWFCLGSGTKKLMCEDGEKEKTNLEYSGTFVGIHLYRQPRSFSGVLEDIISVGEDEAEGEGRQGVASKISKLV